MLSLHAGAHTGCASTLPMQEGDAVLLCREDRRDGSECNPP